MASIKRFKAFLALLLMMGGFTAIPAQASYQRVVSLYTGHTDNIVALGAAAKLVGVSKNDNCEAAAKLPHLAMNAGPEEILALKPDLVLTRGLADRENPNLRTTLERAGIRVLVIDPPKWDEFGGYIKNLAPLVGADSDKAAAKFEKLKESIAAEAVRHKKNKPANVFVEAAEKGLATCTGDSWAAHMVELAGGVNISKGAKPIGRGSAIAPWGLERILESAGNINVYIVQQGPMNAADEESVKKRRWFAALKNAKLAFMPESLLSRPSLLGLERGGAMLIKILYTE
jgi:iron complex transport system substrate-binding protein